MNNLHIRIRFLSENFNVSDFSLCFQWISRNFILFLFNYIHQKDISCLYQKHLFKRLHNAVSFFYVCNEKLINCVAMHETCKSKILNFKTKYECCPRLSITVSRHWYHKNTSASNGAMQLKVQFIMYLPSCRYSLRDELMINYTWAARIDCARKARSPDIVIRNKKNCGVSLYSLGGKMSRLSSAWLVTKGDGWLWLLELIITISIVVHCLQYLYIE